MNGKERISGHFQLVARVANEGECIDMIADPSCCIQQDFEKLRSWLLFKDNGNNHANRVDMEEVVMDCQEMASLVFRDYQSIL